MIPPYPPCAGHGQHCAAMFMFYQFWVFSSSIRLYNAYIFCTHPCKYQPSLEFSTARRLLRRILVMGGTRFIGCYLVAKLREMGHSVVPWLKFMNFSGDRRMYPYQRTPAGNPYISIYKPCWIKTESILWCCSNMVDAPLAWWVDSPDLVGFSERLVGTFVPSSLLFVLGPLPVGFLCWLWVWSLGCHLLPLDFSSSTSLSFGSYSPCLGASFQSVGCLRAWTPLTCSLKLSGLPFLDWGLWLAL